MDENLNEVALQVRQVLANMGVPVTASGSVKKIAPVHDNLSIIDSVDYDEDVNIRLKNGREYYTIALETNLVEHGTIEEIAFEESGDLKFYISTANLKTVEDFLQLHQQQGMYVIDLARFEYLTPQGQFQNKLVTLPDEDWTIKVKVKAKADSDPDKLVLKAHAWSQVHDQGAGRKFKPLSTEKKQDSLAEGTHEWTPYYGSSAKNKFIQRLVFDESEVQISEVIVKRGDRTIHTITKEQNNFWLQRIADMELQSGKFMLDFTMFGYGSQAGGAINCDDLNFDLKVNKKGTVKTLVQGFERA